MDSANNQMIVNEQVGVVVLTSSTYRETLALAETVANEVPYAVTIARPPDQNDRRVETPDPIPSLEKALQAGVGEGWRTVLIVPGSPADCARPTADAVRRAIAAWRKEHPDISFVLSDAFDTHVIGQAEHTPPGSSDHPWRRGRGRNRARCAQAITEMLGQQAEHLPELHIVRLTALQPQERGRVYALPQARRVTSQLATLGFTPGAEVTMLQNYGWGPVIVSVRGARIALGRREARGIRVCLLPRDEYKAPARRHTASG